MMNEPSSKMGATSIAAIMTSLPPPVTGLESGNLAMDADKHDLLGDPNLVENYSDILKRKPNRFSSGGAGSETDNESESASGSVVVTRASASSSPLKQRTSLLSNSSSHYSPQLGYEATQDDQIEEDGEEELGHREVAMVEETEATSDDRTSIETNSCDAGGSPLADVTHEYEYSDSDFEENMEKRLHDMNFNDSPDNHEAQTSDSELEHPVLRLSLSGDDRSDSDGEVQEETDGLTLGPEEDFGADSDSDEYQPLSPPKELDPEKLYALYAFNGPDPSHCQLRQDESCTLLNDQDSYWWLVKRSQDSKIGFAPAEILETFPERLARLNCWKNENMSSSLDESPKSKDKKDEGSVKETNGEVTGEKGEGASPLQNYMKDNKSVSFNDVVSYADRFIETDDEDVNPKDPQHYDQFTEASLRLSTFAEDEENSEVVSDVSFSTASMTPLNIEKVRRPRATASEDSVAASTPATATDGSDVPKEVVDGEKEECDDLHKIFEAPIPPFSKSQSSSVPNMQPSNSDYSISTIGDFSPSSSEWTNESPLLRDAQFNTESDTVAIPPSKAIQDFSKYVEEEPSDGEATSVCKSVESTTDQDKNDKNKIDKESLQENKHSSLESTSSSSDQIFLDSERINSYTSINSATSISRQHSNAKGCPSSISKHHPLIDRLYNPVFDKMDELMAQLDEIVRK